MKDTHKANILIVDDNPQNLISLEAVLHEPHINIVKAGSGNEALCKVLEDDFALVLLDVQMPDMDGFETAEYLRGNQRTRHIPIIFVTAISKEEKHIFKGYKAGAVDYIFKPLEPEIIKNKVNIFLDLFNQKKLIENKIRELEEANKEILEQQKAVVEEERLKVLLQMAGAAAHELNQPLMILLANLEMISLVKDDHEKVMSLISKAQKAGERIATTVKKIQDVRYDTTVDHDSKTKIINLEQPIDISSVEASDEFAEDANTDQLTGLYNRRYLNRVLNREIERAKRYETVLGCLVLDIDHFKTINDTYGHLCGDYLLKEVSKLFMTLKRKPDYIFRYGGEEFVFLIPRTDDQGLLQFAERIRKECEEKEFEYRDTSLRVSLSIGGASFSKEKSAPPTKLLDDADKALYEAKAAGRSCVKVYQ